VAALGFVYVTSAGNMLHDRERHIELLQAELAEARQDHQKLLDSHWRLEQDFDTRRQWVQNLERDIQDMTLQRDRAMARAAELEETQHSLEASLSRSHSLLDEWEEVRGSRWLALGRKLGRGPRMPDRRQ
jgi:chromosome segregation ATPase